jgi:AbrB family looped-hinge helix DNA binding protein
MTYTTRLTKNGQMTLPKGIRDLLRVEPGAQLKVSWENGQAIVGVQDNVRRLREAREDSAAHLKKHGLYGLSDKQLHDRLEQQRAEYYGKKYGIS